MYIHLHSSLSTPSIPFGTLTEPYSALAIGSGSASERENIEVDWENFATWAGPTLLRKFIIAFGMKTGAGGLGRRQPMTGSDNLKAHGRTDFSIQQQ